MAGTHAVVIGASIAGLLAAAALSESFTQVTVYDRDELPDAPDPRKGVPQSRQAHGLHARGLAAMDELLPGFAAELLAAGGVTGDALLDFNWYLSGYQFRHGESGLGGVALTRRLLERLIRARVASLPFVRVVGKTAVDSLDAAAGQITGVRVRGESAVVAADLVVDASGRGSRAPVWLRELGYGEPRTSEVRIDLTYVTRHYQSLPGQLGGRLGASVGLYPGHPRSGIVLRQEGSTFVVLLAGMLGVDPPTDDAGMLAFASELDGPEIAMVLRESAPVDDPVKMRFPASVRHHYETMARHPGGFLVLGDALCSFNPVYGQGMTVAALEALVLRDAVASAGLPRLPRRFYRSARKLVAAAWSLSVAADLSFPEVAGKRRPGNGLVNSYLRQFCKAASVDPALGKAFLQVANMSATPASLLTPEMMIRVLRSARWAVPACQPRHLFALRSGTEILRRAIRKSRSLPNAER
jgi:2-polyprenyl-6-methoxyphenol hydroxylase-like FAD-dependent oxidoreductase